MASTAIDEVLAGLIALWKSAVVDNDPKVTVCDAEDDWGAHLQVCVLVGVQFDIDSQELRGEISAEQTFPNISTRTKEETLAIPHSIITWSGDPKVARRRTQALELYAQLEAKHRDNLKLGLDLRPGADVLVSDFGSDTKLRYLHTNDGNATVLTWMVQTRTRLFHT